MSNINLGAFYNLRTALYQEDNRDIRLGKYVEYLLASYCMPTLLKQKPACLFRANIKNLGNGDHLVKVIEDEIKHFNCETITLYSDDIMLVLLVFHKELLSKTIFKEENRKFLQGAGYSEFSNELEKVLELLKQRYRSFIIKNKANISIMVEEKVCGEKDNKMNEAFPHEIGIILGYPVMDVEEFIKNKGKNYLLCGYWKVYHDVNHATTMFERFKEAREKALQWILEGKQLRDYNHGGNYD